MFLLQKKGSLYSSFHSNDVMRVCVIYKYTRNKNRTSKCTSQKQFEMNICADFIRIDILEHKINIIYNSLALTFSSKCCSGKQQQQRQKVIASSIACFMDTAINKT